MLNKKSVIGIFAVVLFIVYYGTYLKMVNRGSVPQTLAANPVPDFKWQDFTDKTHDIKELSGKVVILHFWATWCVPCRKEFPKLINAAKLLGDNVVFLTISVDDDTKTADNFIAKLNIEKPNNLLFAIDKDRKIAFDIFQTVAYPETIIIDTKQQMRQKFIGSVNWESEDNLGMIKSLLK